MKVLFSSYIATLVKLAGYTQQNYLQMASVNVQVQNFSWKGPQTELYDFDFYSDAPALDQFTMSMLKWFINVTAQPQ